MAQVAAAMPALATTQPTDVPEAPAPSRRQRIPKRIRQAVELIASGEVTTQKAAAERVGLSPEHLSRMLARDHVRVFLTRAASRTIAGAQLRASRRYVELIEAESEHVAAKVCDRLLTSEGVLRSEVGQVSVNVDIKAGFVIDLSEPREINGQAHTPHKPLIEHDPVWKAHSKQDGGR